MGQASKESQDECNETDIKSSLENIIGDAGAVNLEYGGFTITILDNSRFPWYEALDNLVGECFEVWVNRKDLHLVIVAKQKID